MSVSGSRMAFDINLEEFERRLRAAGTQPAGAEDPLFELARLVESSRPAAAGAASPLRADAERPRPLEAAALRPAFDETPEAQGKTDEAEPAEVPAFPDFHENDHDRSEQPTARRSGGWGLKVSALAVAGVAMIGAVFALKGGVPGLPKQPPYIAAAQGPNKVLPPSDDTVAASNDTGASLLKDTSQSAHVKVVASEEQPVDLNALAASGAASAAASNPPIDASGGTAVRGTVDTPVVVAAPRPPLPAASQFPDPKPVRTVSLRPDGTPIPSPVVASADASGVAPATEAPNLPAKPAPKATTGAAAIAQPSTPKVDLPTKISGKSSARVVVAKTDTTAPSSIAEAANEPLQPGAMAKSEKAARAAKSRQAAAEPATRSTSLQQTVDSTVATKSSGWAVQLAAPKSDAEAKSEATQLNAKYASTLNGSTIGVHKAVVNGETIYRLRVVGLSKADAAALCARLKGDGGDCFIAK